jgi:type II secretory pathway pseudopilin PulG
MGIRFKVRGSRFEERELPQQDEQGFMLLGLIVAITLILLGLSVAASKVAFSLKREREAESVRRAKQYVRAIRVFYRKNNKMYPGSLEQLEDTNHVRYLRQRYVDPLTGNSDWKLIKVGTNKTQVKGFFGEPLEGIASAGLGAAAGMQSTGVGGPGTQPASGTNPTATTGTTPGATTPSAFGAPLSGAFMGVGSSATGHSIVEWNAQTTYQEWEFLYDPRIELLIAKAMMNSGLGTAGAGGLGQTPDQSGQTPGQMPGQTPGQAPGQIPGQVPGQTPGLAPGQNPGSPPTSTPTNPTPQP